MIPPGEISVITTSDGSHSLLNTTLNETYHSVHGAIQESKHVFIEAGLKNYTASALANQVRIFEAGFGTGLNALLTALYSRETTSPLYYESWELHPLQREVWEQLNYSEILGASELFQIIHEAAWDKPIAITDRFTLHKRNLDLVKEIPAKENFNLIYYDAFAPAKQPEMWSREVLNNVVNAMISNGSGVTYCAKGQVKRDLVSLGCNVETLAGPPGKKEMIRFSKS